ncbi:biotin/methionine sulfoxide reductase [Mumia flava]|uniref:Biotin/methionine sulfoxide reductase n=1 Tax=Mumia flava TaxID=1348852 RepID=A0A2M9BI93_9ACTN|nr:molybdopterin-dependent oxidoreductase [Mumia flava]PJJ57671.1 biotin/methionine sulfoxide reductase [Mumia flava]
MASERTVPHSSHVGAFSAHVRDGRLVGVTPHPLDPDPAPLLGSVVEAATGRTRIRRPALRRSVAEHGPGAAPQRRGIDDFVEVGWDEALDLVAAELTRVRTEHGPASIFGGSYGWSSAGRFHHAKTQLNRFLAASGGYTAQSGNYSFAAALRILPHVLGDARATDGTVTSLDVVAEHTDLWLMLGGAPVRTTQVESGGVVAHRARADLGRVAASTELVHVGPLRDDAPPSARWLPARPGTDTALLLALMHTLVVESLHDQPFLDRCCTGWPRLRAYLLGETDGQPKSADWAAPICDLPARTIRDLAVRAARGRTLVSATWSLQRAEHGEQPFWAVIALAAVLGQIGLPGGGFGFGYGNAASIGAHGPRSVGLSMPTLPNPADSWIPVARIADMLLHPGAPYEVDGQHRSYPDVRLVYWAGGNPFHHHQDLNRLARAWQRPETVVVHETCWTATARRADVVLPATVTLERDDLSTSSRDTSVVAMHRAVEPYGRARDDFAILADLAERLGCRDAFTEGRDADGWLRHLWATTRAEGRAAGVELPDFATLWARGRVELPTEPSLVLLADFRADPEAHRLGTPSGRIELFSETLDGFGYDDCPAHPTWLEPREWLGSPDVARHPFHLVSNQPASRLHGQMDTGPVSAASKVAGREPCRMHPEDAAAYGIADGDVVRLHNDRGAVLAGAVLDPDVRRGVVQLATGAWYDPADAAEPKSLDLHGNPNVLTADRPTSRLAQGPSAHSTLVAVERYAGSAPPITVHDPPALVRGVGVLGKDPDPDSVPDRPDRGA